MFWHPLMCKVLTDWDCTRTLSSELHSLRSISASLGHAVIGDTTKFLRLDDPVRLMTASSGGDSLTTSLQKASLKEAVFSTLI